MKSHKAKSIILRRHISALLGLWLGCALAFPTRLAAIEDPPNCSIANGGLGNTSQGGVGFNTNQAHIGDIVPVHASLGMVSGGCRALSVTGAIYVATGLLTNFLVNATLNPGDLHFCPTDERCTPGPYNLTITPDLVGAPVVSPLGSVPGVAKTVRVVENGVGTVLAGDVNEALADFHSGSLSVFEVVTPCIQVVTFCDLAPGESCFPAATSVRFRGYVTNCGDITLTNVAIADDRAGALQLFNSTNGSALTGNVILAPGAYAVFSNSFLPTAQETSAGRATNVTTATARDTTGSASANAFVTNSVTGTCAICGGNPTEDPPGCSIANGGLGNTSQGGCGFYQNQAHVGDVVPVHATLGMVSGACKATNVTGSIYTAAGLLTNFLVNVTLDPGSLIYCPDPGNALCQPGPYAFTITSDLVGAPVNTPVGSVAGTPKVVRVVENGTGTVFTGNPPEQMADFHVGTVAIQIVSPAIQAVTAADLPEGQSFFPAGTPVRFRGYVTNRGDIALTNVTVVDSRAGQMQLHNPADGTALTGNVILSPGEHAVFTNSFMPTPQETSAGKAMNVISATARDTTEIGGPRAFVTNSMAGTSAICPDACLGAVTYAPNNQFKFTVEGRAGSNYVIQMSTNLRTATWLSVLTNTAPFTFVESNAQLYPTRFYRAKLLP